MDDVDRLIEHLESLPGVKRKGTTARPAWYVDDRLIARAEEPDRWTIRCDFDLREQLLDAHPSTFGVPPRIDAHQKVEAYLDDGEWTAIRQALDAAWAMQRKH